MPIRMNISSAFLAISAMVILASNTHAAFIFSIQQIGRDVVVTGSGTINTSALNYYQTSSGSSGMFPAFGDVEAGPATPTVAESFSGLSGPYSFGTGEDAKATSGNGDDVGVGFGRDISVPSGYVSGAPLADSATFSGVTFFLLGLAQGSYIYTWGSGPTADSLTVNIGTVPEPATLVAMAIPGTIVLLRRRRSA